MGQGRINRAVIGVLAAVVAASAPAHAGAAEWAAHYLSQNGAYTTGALGPLEAGQTAPGWFKAQNTGTGTWVRGAGITSGVLLGTFTPGAVSPDRASAFANNSWVSAARPTKLAEASVAPGGTGTFNFTITAPAAATTYNEYFALVNEGVSWMATGEGWYLPITVLPGVPPQVQFTSTPERVLTGAVLDLAAFASDNGAVDKVVFTLEGSGNAVLAKVEKAAAPYAVAMPSAGVSPGQYTLRARAVDKSGREASVVRSVLIDAAPVDSPETPGLTTVPLTSAPLNSTPIGDADADGLLDLADRCPNQHRGPSDRDGDGCPGPLERLNGHFSIDWKLEKGRLRVVKARILDVPAGATVVVRCANCAVKETLVGKGSTLNSRALKGKRLKPGALIEATITKAGTIGRVEQYVVARRPTLKRPFAVQRRELCVLPGAKPQKVCTG